MRRENVLAIGFLAASLAAGACASVPSMPDELEIDTDPSARPVRTHDETPPAASSSGGAQDLPPAPSGSGSGTAAPPATGGPDAGAPPGAGGSCVGATGTTSGPIDLKYKSLGGCSSVLGLVTSNELAASDGAGRFNTFERGAIYWTPTLGAWEVHGLVYDRWKALGRETSVVGYPITDERTPPDGIGRYGVFERGSIYWSPTTGAHEVLGRIRDKWKDMGWEAGLLGYPISGEYAVTGGRRSDFQHGSLVWRSANDTVSMDSSPPPGSP